MRVHLPLILTGLLAFSSCASIVSKSRYPVAISSVPNGATISITDRRGKEVYTGVTPAAVVLKSGAGYFQRQIYTVKFSKNGYSEKAMTLEADLNGWYFGNLVFGGFIGLLIVDPATGAMYRIADRDLQGVLSETTAQLNPFDSKGLQIVSVEDVPSNLRSKMVPLQ